jgi:hypothetical protein
MPRQNLMPQGILEKRNHAIPGLGFALSSRF